jgi:hypothetical protein
MKQKLSVANTISTTILFMILAVSKLPLLLLSSFILLISKGIKMYIESTNDDIIINENQPKENFSKLLIIRLAMQVIPLLFIILCFYLLLAKKDLILNIF